MRPKLHALPAFRSRAATRWLLPLTAAMALAACGGGGGGGVVFPPVATPPAGGGNGDGNLPTTNQGKSGPKALVVQIDGLTHAALRDAMAQNKVPALQGLKLAPAWTGGANGALTEQRTTASPGWATLVTGTWAQRHSVQWDTADQRIDARLAPSVFALAKLKKDAGYLTASVTAGANYRSLLANESGTLDAAVDCAGADACVTERTAQLIDQGWDLLVAQYGAPAAAAPSGPRGEAYQRAVSDTAAAVGQLLARIARRSANDAKEDWLVVLTTPNGLDAFGNATGTQSAQTKTIFVASNKTLAALPATGEAAPADVATLTKLAAATDIAPTVLRHLGALPAAEAYRFNGQPLQAATALRGLVATTGADKASVDLSWTLAGNANVPVKVLRDGKLVATLAAGATAYNDPVEAASDGILAFDYTVVAGDASLALPARVTYVKPATLAPTLRNGLVNYYPLDALPPADRKSASTLAPWAAGADGGSLVDDGFKAPYKAKALRVDSSVKTADGTAGYRLVQTADVATAPSVTAYTIGFWLRTDASCSVGAGDGASVIANKNYDSGSNAGLAIGLFDGCELRFNVGKGGGRADSNGYRLSAGQWAYVAVVIDKANLKMTGYLFDAARALQTGSADMTADIVAQLGGLKNGLSLNEDGTGQYYKRWTSSPRGPLDFNEFGIWNRALAADELTSIFKSGQPLSTLEP